MKTCPRCMESLPATAEHFRARFSGSKRLRSWCRICEREYGLGRYYSLRAADSQALNALPWFDQQTGA